jgi:hypothetical protein
MPHIVLSADQARLLSEVYPVQVLDPEGNVVGHIEPVGESVSPQAAFLRLPLAERTRLLAEQSQQMKDYYAQTIQEREEWQSGDFQDEH